MASPPVHQRPPTFRPAAAVVCHWCSVICWRPSTPALHEAAHVALHAPFRKLQLRVAVGTGTGKRLLHATKHHLLASSPDLSGRLGQRRVRFSAGHLRGYTGEQLLLDALLLLHPALDGDADRIVYRQDLVGAQADRAVGADAAKLAVNLLDRYTRSQPEAEEPPKRCDVQHLRAARPALS